MLKNLQESDKSGLLLALLVVTGIIGNHLLPINVGGINLFFFRLLLILFSPFVFRNFRLLNFRYNSANFWFIHFCFFWLIYGMVSLLFIKDFMEGFKAWMALVWGVVIFIMFCQLMLMTGKKMPYYFCLGLLLANLICIPVALWELTTLNHLKGYYIANLPDYALDRKIAIAFLENPNGYAYFMVLSQPFLYYLYTIAHSRFLKFIVLITCLITPYLLYFTDARFSIVVFLLNVFLFGWFILKKKLNMYAVSMSVVLICFVMIFGGWKFLKQGFKEKLEVSAETSSKETFQIRVNHFKNCVYYTVQTWGLGLGPSTYENIGSYNKPYYTYGNESPHNMVIEVIVNYGVYIGMLLVVFIVAAVSNSDIKTTWGVCILITTIGFMLLAAQNSTYLKTQVTWIFLSIIFYRLPPERNVQIQINQL